jgi:hypothetical protein
MLLVGYLYMMTDVGLCKKCSSVLGKIMRLYIVMTDPWKFISNMSYSSVSLLDLSDEILLIILKKLKWVHIFDSLFNVDERLNRLIVDSVIHASYIDLFVISSTDKIDSIAKTILDRICSSILPQIHQHIKCLALESSSMERILLATDYPKLKTLGLFGMWTRNDYTSS